MFFVSASVQTIAGTHLCMKFWVQMCPYHKIGWGICMREKEVWITACWLDNFVLIGKLNFIHVLVLPELILERSGEEKRYFFKVKTCHFSLRLEFSVTINFTPKCSGFGCWPLPDRTSKEGKKSNKKRRINSKVISWRTEESKNLIVCSIKLFHLSFPIVVWADLMQSYPVV